MNSYGVIEIPVISLLAGLMILAGFMEELGAFGSIARFIQRPCRCCLSSDIAGGVTVGMRCADRTQVWKNVLVGGVLTAMTALFLLGPTLGHLDVGGVAFMIGLCCLVGLGIWSARTEAAEMVSAAEHGSVASDLDSTKTVKKVMVRLKESVGVQDLASANPAEDLAGGRKSTLLMICLVSALLSAIIMNDTVCLVFAPMIVSKLQGVEDHFPYLYAPHTHDSVLCGAYCQLGCDRLLCSDASQACPGDIGKHRQRTDKRRKSPEQSDRKNCRSGFWDVCEVYGCTSLSVYDMERNDAFEMAGSCERDAWRAAAGDTNTSAWR
eukprot:COSAG06_NODE_2794_length_6274_cov_2.952551_6_plen_323_part_00